MRFLCNNISKQPVKLKHTTWEDNIKMDIQKSVMWGHGLDFCGSG
jgi:hypothetical protein